MAYRFENITKSHDPRFNRSKTSADRIMRTQDFKLMLRTLRTLPIPGTDWKRDYMIFLCMGNLGLRLSEVSILKVSDFHLDYAPPFAKVRVLKKRKKDKQPYKEVYLHWRVVRKLQQYIGKLPRNQKYMFVGASSHHGESGHLSYREISRIFIRYCSHIGFKRKYSCHSVRHMFVTNLWRKTKDPIFVRHQTGHASAGIGFSQASEDYLHLLEEDVPGLVAKMGFFI